MVLNSEGLGEAIAQAKQVGRSTVGPGTMAKAEMARLRRPMRVQSGSPTLPMFGMALGPWCMVGPLCPRPAT